MNPVLVEILRGDRVESFHRGAAVVCDASGQVLDSRGDVGRAIYPRSALKPLQCLPLVAGGAADRLGLTDAEIALACGSHSGEPVHVTAVSAFLRKAGRDESCLECGVHWPLGERAARELAARGGGPTPLHNNCSGKHAGFVCLAAHRGLDPTGYVRHDHPVMREVTAAVAAATGARLDDSCRATDGCSIPAFAVPLESLATGFARLGTGDRLDDPLARATARIRRALAGNPWAVAGEGRFDTRIMGACGGAVLSKCGAEGVAAAAIPAAGIGLAVKIDDGAGRAAEVAMAALLRRFLSPPLADHPALAVLADVVLTNWNGLTVGRIRADIGCG